MLPLLIRLAQSALLTRVMKIEDYGLRPTVLNLFVFLDSFWLARQRCDIPLFPSFQEQGDRSSVKGLDFVPGNLFAIGSGNLWWCRIVVASAG